MNLVALLFFSMFSLTHGYLQYVYNDRFLPQSNNYGSFESALIVQNKCKNKNKFTLSLEFKSPPKNDIFVNLSTSLTRVPSYTAIFGPFSKISSLITVKSTSPNSNVWLRKLDGISRIEEGSVLYLEFNVDRIKMMKTDTKLPMETIIFPITANYVSPNYISLGSWYGEINFSKISLSCEVDIF
ncbi:hypothetical protein BB561_006469 [Smittium simulii]|uniref:Uncharacterized protein n=1 Tax=Smittium simulii TaxID=133385 RepID=A0A2T9Y3Y6_9FUNG|nr:hypothetical protein BB561_006469 [Smittium simulii]